MVFFTLVQIGYFLLDLLVKKSRILVMALTLETLQMDFFLMDENMVKGVKGTKVKVLFQRLHMTCVIKFVLFYNFKMFISGTPFNIAF